MFVQLDLFHPPLQSRSSRDNIGAICSTIIRSPPLSFSHLHSAHLHIAHLHNAHLNICTFAQRKESPLSLICTFAQKNLSHLHNCTFAHLHICTNNPISLICTIGFELPARSLSLIEGHHHLHTPGSHQATHYMDVGRSTSHLHNLIIPSLYLGHRRGHFVAQNSTEN